MDRLTKTFEANESYNVRFLPNINNIKDYCIELVFTGDQNPALSKRYFSYILRNNEATPVSFGLSISKMIKYCLNGYTGTPEGHFITDLSTDTIDRYPNMFDKYNKLKSYFATEEKRRITLDKEKAKDEKLLEFTDMVEYNPRMPFDIKSGISLMFETSSQSGYIEYKDLRWVNIEPLWNDTMPKENITNLYKDVPSLENVVESEIDYLQRSLISGKILIGEEATKFYWDYRRNK